MKIQLKDIEGLDLDGRKIQGETCKAVGNIVYTNATTLEFDELSRAIYKGKAVEVTAQQLEVLEHLLLGDQTPLILPFKKALKDYFNTIKSNKDETEA